MGQHRALGPPGGARGVHQQGHVVGMHIGVDFCVRRGGQEGLVFAFVVAAVAASAVHHLVEVNAVLQAFRQMAEFVVIEESARAGILNDVLDLRHRQTEIDRQEDGAQLGNGENQFELRVAVLQQRTDAVAGAHTAVAHGVGKPVTAPVQLPVSEAQMAVHDRQTVTGNHLPFGNPVPQPLIHNNLANVLINMEWT